MANLKDIRKRIGSVKSTQKITRAMKMVAAARLRKAQQRITDMRPYAVKTMDVMSGVAARCEEDAALHPLLERRNVEKVLLVVITSDRGLAGAFNASLNKTAFRYWKELEAQGKEVRFAVVGRKGKEYLRNRGATIDHEFTNILNNVQNTCASEIGRYIVRLYEDADLDAAYLVYNEFKSAISQQPVIETLLPVRLKEIPEDAQGDFIYEPSQKELLNRLLPMYVDVEIFRALLESVASEHGARMTAMDAATNNAKDMISRLTLEFNRARQAAITKELMEIISGSEALN